MSDREVIALAAATMKRVRELAEIPEDLPCGLVEVDVSGTPYSHGWEFAAPGVFYEFRGGYRLRPKARRQWRLDIRVTGQRGRGREPKGAFMPLSWCWDAREALEVVQDFIRGVNATA